MVVNIMKLMTWPDDKLLIEKRISRSFAPLKVILKTRNESDLLRIWIDHYLKFLTPEEIIIADNFSDDPKTLAIYQSLDPGITIFQFASSVHGEYHNVIHNPIHYSGLYKSLRESCDHYMIADTDELLLYSMRENWHTDRKKIHQELASCKDLAIATVWLVPIPASKSICILSSKEKQVIQGIAWGKPILPASMTYRGSLIHNGQFLRDSFTTRPEGIFILLHLKQYSVEQRLLANRQKLIVRGAIDHDTSFSEIAALSAESDQDWVVGELVLETKRLLSVSRETDPGVTEDLIEFEVNGLVVCHTTATKNIYTEMLINQDDLMDSSFLLANDYLKEKGKSKNDGNQSDNPKTRNMKGSIDRTELALRRAMEVDPQRMDQYGDPMYRKELLRLLLAEGRWQDAEDVIPGKADSGVFGWHHILFARALDKAGRRVEAVQHWKEFLRNRPHHEEALRALRSETKRLPLPLSHIVQMIPRQRFDIIFDVGANIGQSCVEYATALPNSKIYAFEPVPDSFFELSGVVSSLPNITPYNLALAENSGTLQMFASGSATTNRIVSSGSEGNVAVTAVTIEEFCAQNGIAHLDFLKIDTEGHDLSVLRGCRSMLAEIDFIQCEVSANKYNQFHVAFTDVYDFLTEAGFHLFHIYGQTFEWASGGYPILRRFDPVFINARVARASG